MPQPFLSTLSAILTEIEGRELMHLAHDRSFSAGTVLYEEGAKVESVFILMSGQLALERFTAGGDRQILSFVFTGDMIGLDLGGKHISGATALTDCSVKAIKRSALDSLIRDRSALADAFGEQTRLIVAHMLDHICALGWMTARQRVVFFLLHLRDRHKHARLETRPMQLSMTRQDIGDFLGIRVETAIRSISQLAKDGLIRIENDSRIELLDEEALKNELP